MTAGAFLSYDGQRALSGSLVVPWTGAWAADLELADVADVATTAVLALGNLSLLGTVYRSAVYAGRRSLRLVGGYGGWRRTVPARSYTHPSALTVGLVLGDVAATVGERLAETPGTVLGSYYVREAGPAERVLRQLAGDDWHVDPAGLTRLGPRASSTIESDYLVNDYTPALGQLVISTEDYASWLPGATFSNALVPDVQTVSMVRAESSNAGVLRHTVLAAGPDTDRLLGPMRALIQAETPTLAYHGLYRYSVQSTDGDAVSCSPVSSASGMPPLVRVPLAAGLAGMRARPRAGQTVLIAFLDGSPLLPCVVGGLGIVGSTAAVVCYGDTVTVGSTGGPITGVASTLRRVEAEVVP